ncbi:MAG: peptidoglycan-binding protein [Candidatus Gracilibacteria bacterium]|nr:peptidoglycan-binding protein [Candidatus Gracilibacteria bacterium]
MVLSSSLSASSLLSAHIRQDVSLVFVSQERIQNSFKNIRKYIYALVAVIGFCGFLPSSGYAATVGETQEFIVTAYYSPLPGQSFYLKGNYDAERRLNGNGTNGASGSPVFTGMIAAPKTYDFGTKINFDGLGIGTVSDRGGAIVSAGERGQVYDRIDIWMGYGESGLKRALIWGRRKVTGVIVESSASGNPIDLAGIDSGKVDISQFEKVTATLTTALPAEVQDMFADLGYTTEGRTTKEMILAFQLDHGVISSASDPGAGNYGPLTTAKLQEEYARYASLRDTEMKRIEKERAQMVSENSTWATLITRAETQVNQFGSPKRGEKGSHVRELQAFLQNSGYLRKNAPVGVMNPATILALKSFQKKNGIPPTGKIDTWTHNSIIETMIQKNLI